MSKPEGYDLLSVGLRDAYHRVQRVRLAGLEPLALVVPVDDDVLVAERVFGLPVVHAKVDRPGVIV